MTIFSESIIPYKGFTIQLEKCENGEWKDSAYWQRIIRDDIGYRTEYLLPTYDIAKDTAIQAIDILIDTIVQENKCEKYGNRYVVSYRGGSLHTS